MRKKIFSICAFILCTAMLSGCNANESGSKTETVSNSETTVSAENASETTQTEVDTETTTEETEPEVEISYQKIREITYPADGDSYVSKEYEYGDNNYYKETAYLYDGTILTYTEQEYGNDGYYKVTNYNYFGHRTTCTEYKNGIKIKETEYLGEDLAAGYIYEYDESELNYITKSSHFDNREQEVIQDNYEEYKSSESIHDYQFNDDRTEAIVTITTTSTFKNSDRIDKVVVTYIQKYEYDELGRVIHEWGYYTTSEGIDDEYYYTYDNTGNRLITKKGGFSTTIYEYDDNGNMTMEKDDYALITCEYDDSNNLTYKHEEYGSSESSIYDTYYEYDEYGRQIGYTNYDVNGNETSHTVVEYE